MPSPTRASIRRRCPVCKVRHRPPFCEREPEANDDNLHTCCGYGLGFTHCPDGVDCEICPECPVCNDVPEGWWSVFKTDHGTAHLVPNNDQTDHAQTEDCACGPRVEAVMRDNGSNGWLYVHHSLDGREALEPRGGMS